jgi:barstar (barnase inhibitor)
VTQGAPYPDSGFYRPKGADVLSVISDLENLGSAVFAVTGAPSTKAEFVAAVQESLPLDPPIHRGVWDALADSLWEGLHQPNRDRIAIVWPYSERLRDGDPNAYDIAMLILEDLVRSLADPGSTLGRATALLVVLP